MSVRELLRVFCGEVLHEDSHWERIGKEYDPFQIRIYQAGKDFYTTELPFTNLFSFPQILDVRVFNVSEYSLVALWVWRKLRDANRVVHTFEDYEDKIRRLDHYDFICWYRHRSKSKYSSFEDRVFIRSTKYLRLLKSLYYERLDELEELISRLKEKLLLKNEKFYIREVSPISK
jgi:hypothetical protein